MLQTREIVIQLQALRGWIISLLWIAPALALFGQATPPTASETPAPGNPGPAAPHVQTNAPPAFKVEAYEISGVSLLSVERLTEIFTPYLGTNIGIAQILQAASDLQLEYKTRGYPTVNVVLPPQKITNAIVRIQVLEGILSEIVVRKNHHFSSNNVVRTLPSLKTGIILNSHVFQAELDRANANRDRQIYPQIAPGAETNTSLMILEVKDRTPFHARLDFNNLRTPDSPAMRLNGNLSYDNLWQLEHSIGFQYGFSPESFKPKSVPGFSMNLLDSPSVANYSAFYRAPLLSSSAVAEEIERDPTAYGYNEATRRFQLPPASGRPELSFFASRSTTDLDIDGPLKNVVRSALLNIDSRITTRNITRDHSGGLRLSLPQATSGNARGNWTLGFDYKEHLGGFFPSNVFITTATITNSAGQAEQRQDISVIPGSSSRQRYGYLTSSLGWQGTRPDLWGQTMGSATFLFGTARPLTSVEDFQSSSSTNAHQQFMIWRMRLAREQKLFQKWNLGVAVEGQTANQALVSLEQFGLGGMSSVRGYKEGEMYGDQGFFTQIDLRFPPFEEESTFNGKPVHLGANVSLFTDFGRIYYKEPAGRNPSADLWGAGLAASSYFGKHFEAKMILGWAMIGTLSRRPGDFLGTFVLTAKF